MRFDVTSSPSSPEFPIYAMPPNFHRRVADALADDALRATLTRSTGLLRQQQAAGFADSAHFTRTFVQTFGVPPSPLRSARIVCHEDRRPPIDMSHPSCGEVVHP